MPDFAYIARDLTGQKVSGVIEAGSQNEATAALGARDLFPLEVSTRQNVRTGRAPRVRAQAIATMYNQLAALLQSGVPLLRSLNVLGEQTSHAGLARILDDVHDQLEDGSNLADAMGRYESTFGSLAINIVRAGEEGGFLEQALERIALFTEQQDELKGRVIGALAYPMILIIVGTIVVNGLIIFLVPQFEQLFSDLRQKGEMPFLTDALLWLSGVMINWGPYLLVAFVVLAFVIRAQLATEQGRAVADRWRLRAPLAGKIYLDLAVARFCRVLGTLLSGGVPIVRSLEIASNAAGNRVLASAVQDAAENITAGQSLTKPLAQCGHFPQDVVEMIAVAEESNTLEIVLTNIADSLEKRTWRRLDLLVRMLEPVMLLMLATVVLLVVIAMLYPLMKMGLTV